MSKDFVHLHIHTDASTLDGAMSIDNLLDRAEELGMKQIALTNHGNMIQMNKYIQVAAKRGIHLIPGCEMYMTWDYPCTIKDKEHGQRYHFIALAKNNIGYQNLIKLTSESYVSGFYNKPRVDKELIEQYKEGIIFTTACIFGPLNRRYVNEGKTYDEIKEDAEWLQEVLKGQIYLELQRHPNFPDQDVANEMLVRLSKETGIPLTVGCDSHYARPSDFTLFEAMSFLAMGGNEKYTHTNDYYVKSKEEMWDLFSDIPEALENTVKIANECNEITFENKYIYPALDTGDLTPDEYLTKEAYEGLDRRLAQNGLNSKRSLYQERLQKELDVLISMGFSSYILVVSDFIKEAKRRGIPVGPGRGSSAGSLLCWAVEITEIDSIKYDLLFERFQNPERVSQPDVDTDFADDRRDEMKEYMAEKYGKDHVASILTIGTIAAKGALRDACRYIGMDYSSSDTFAKQIPLGKRGKNVYLKTITDKDHPDYCKDFVSFANTSPAHRKALEIALQLETKIRSTGSHAAGVVVTFLFLSIIRGT